MLLAIKVKIIGCQNGQGTGLRIEFGLDRSDCRRWLLKLREEIERAGHCVRFHIQDENVAPDRALDHLLAAEKYLFGPGERAWEPLAPQELDQPELVKQEPAPEDGQPLSACRINLSGGNAAGASPDLQLRLDGRPGIASCARSLISGRIPLVGLHRADGSIAASGLPAVEEPEILTRACAQFTARIGTLILMAIDGQPRTETRSGYRSPKPSRRHPYLFGLRSFTSKVARRLFGTRLNADHWRVGLRPVRGPLAVDCDILIEDFEWLADDGLRYYADPVLWVEGERTFLFVEEYPYATERGIIAYTELDETGRPLFTPRPIIERKTHLSYPFIFRHAGALYMMPENAAEGHVPLYRAKHFPDVWEEVAPLVPDIGLHDATLFEHDGGWWLFGNEARQGGSSWDCLLIFRGETPLGPFAPHAANPVIVDGRVARSGGPILRKDGKLLRPAQSCLGGYGRFLRFLEIETLTMETFSQRGRGRMLAPLGSTIAGVHTHARTDRFEAIDALTPRAFRG